MLSRFLRLALASACGRDTQRQRSKQSGNTPAEQTARVYSHDGPIRRRKRGYILPTDESDAGRTALGGHSPLAGRCSRRECG
eukprot:5709077-Pyramimonas_sp.AAC.1